jgi:hypothetical protein
LFSLVSFGTGGDGRANRWLIEFYSSHLRMAADHDIEPPIAQRVARRAMVLAAVACRSFSDHDPDNADAQDLWQRLKDWMQSLEVDSEIEPYEAQIIYKPLGSLSNEERLAGTWGIEGLAMLAWALGLLPFPAHDQQVDPYEVTDAVALLNPDAADIINSADLRTRKELTACRELLYAIHCRLRQFNRDRSLHDIAHWIESDWLQTLGIDNVLASTGDLAVNGVPLAESLESAWRSCESVTFERHRAAIWLIGEYGPIYSEVSVDT